MGININEHNKPIPKIWYRVLLTIHGILGLSIFGAIYQNKPWFGLVLAVLGYILDQVIRFIKQDNPDLENNN